VSYEPQFQITTHLLSRVETIARLHGRIAGAVVDVPWIPALQKDARTRNAHSSTAIEGNPLTLEQVRAVADGAYVPAAGEKPRREVLNYFAALRYIESQPAEMRITHEEIFSLHGIMADGVMDQGEAGRYRTIQVRVGSHVPPPSDDVSGLMFELLEWWNLKAAELSPVLSSAVLHYRFEEIHPFADGNGRTGRALALWELYRRGFDSHHIFSVDEFYWEDRPRYYTALEAVEKAGGDLTAWLEYAAEGLQSTLERAWQRIQDVVAAAAGNQKLVLRPRQEQLLRLLREQSKMRPAELREALGVSPQGMHDLLRPLIEARLVVREGTNRSGYYRLV
jgi:Fic family protein